MVWPARKVGHDVTTDSGNESFCLIPCIGKYWYFCCLDMQGRIRTQALSIVSLSFYHWANALHTLGIFSVLGISSCVKPPTPGTTIILSPGAWAISSLESSASSCLLEGTAGKSLQWLECQWVGFRQSISEFYSGVYQPFFIKCIQLWLSLFHAKTGLSDFRGCDVFNCNTVKRFNGPIKWCEYLEVLLYLHAIACIFTLLFVSSRYCFGLNCPSESWFWPVWLHYGG